ncbi:uncharacterized protein V6R79_013858 [Siganus canaliculatus]
MAAARRNFRDVTSYSNPFMTLTAVDESEAGVNVDYVNERNKGHEHCNPFLCVNEPAVVRRKVTETLYEPPQPKLQSTNPFVAASVDNYCVQDGVANMQSDSCFLVHNHQSHTKQVKPHHTAMPPAVSVTIPYSNPFHPAHAGSFIQSTPVSCYPPCSTCPELHSSCYDPPRDIYYGHVSEKKRSQASQSCFRNERPKSRARQSHHAHYQRSSGSEEDDDSRERVPILRPGQYDGTTPWKEFLHKFESCAEANHWSERTMAVHLKFCLVGAAGAIVQRNPQSFQWDYSRLVEEMEMAYGPSSEHAAAVAIELRQRVRKLGEALHVLRDDIYDKVSAAYSDRTEAEQDAIGVEVFTNTVGDAEIVQKLLEQRPRTLAQAYDIARRHETTKRAAAYVTGLMHSGAHSMTERRPRAAVVREVTEARVETAASSPAATWEPRPPNTHYSPRHWRSHKDINRDEVRCHNCSGLGHMKRDCPSPRKATRPRASVTAPDGPEPAVLHLNARGQEMSVHIRVHEVEVCAVLDSGARKSVLPLCHYNAIRPDIRPPLQPSIVKTLLGVGPGDVPVLGETHIPVQINSRQVDVHFLVANISGDEALLGHPFLCQAQACLDFGNHRIMLFGEEVPYFHQQRQPKTHAVRVARTVVLEAGQEYVVRGNTHLRGPVKGEVLLSPTRGFVERHRLLVARVLVEAQSLKTVPFRIFNPGNAAVTVKEGAIAGFLQSAQALQPTETGTQHEMTFNSPPTVPEHLQELYAQSSPELSAEDQHQLAQLLSTYGDPSSDPVSVRHQAVQCELDSGINSVMPSPVGVEREPAQVAVSLVGLDDLVYRIQKGPKTKVKVVHHDQLKPYRCRDQLDNTWAIERARSWAPLEVSPPALDMDSAGPDLGLVQLFSSADADKAAGPISSEQPATSHTSVPVHMDCSVPGHFQDSGGGVTDLQRQSQRSPRPSRRRGAPTRDRERLQPESTVRKPTVLDPMYSGVNGLKLIKTATSRDPKVKSWCELFHAI